MIYDSAALGSTAATGSVVLAFTSEGVCACRAVGDATGCVEQPPTNANSAGIKIAEQALLAN